MKYQRALLSRNFLSQYCLGSCYLSQEWKWCVNSFANTVHWVAIAQSIIPSVPKLLWAPQEGRKELGYLE